MSSNLALHLGLDQDGRDYQIPVDAVTETFAVLAKRGSGKTYLASVMAEEMLNSEQQIVVVDPVGVWWGLRSSETGKRPGYHVVIFGGSHGDVPLEPTSGVLIADVVHDGFSVILDLSLLSKTGMRRFMADFLERLYQRNRTPLHVFVDEADAFAPQRVYTGGERLLGAMDDIVRRGRARGIGATLITQRPAVLNKDVLTQAEVLVALRMTGPRDVAAIDDWVSLHAEIGEAAALKHDLPALPIGTAYFWSPGWLGAMSKVHIRRRTTFDSSATPKVGAPQVNPRARAEIDLEKLGAQIAATAAKAKADDPKTLHARIAELERALDDVKPEVKEVSILDDADRDLLRKLIEKLGGIAPAPFTSQAIKVPFPQQIEKARPTAPPPLRATGGSGTELPKAQKAVLTALAQHGPRSVDQLAVHTGYSQSGHFSNVLAALRKADYAEGKGTLSITAAGLEALGSYELLPTGRALAEWWMTSGGLGKAEKLILGVCLEAYPRAVAVADIAEATGYQQSGHFSNMLARLRKLELVSGRGELTASSLLVD